MADFYGPCACCGNVNHICCTNMAARIYQGVIAGMGDDWSTEEMFRHSCEQAEKFAEHFGVFDVVPLEKPVLFSELSPAPAQDAATKEYIDTNAEHSNNCTGQCCKIS